MSEAGSPPPIVTHQWPADKIILASQSERATLAQLAEQRFCKA